MKIPEIPQVPFDENHVERLWKSTNLNRFVVIFGVIDILFLLTLPVSTAFYAGGPQGLLELLEQIPLFTERSIAMDLCFSLLNRFAIFSALGIFLIVWFRSSYKERVGKRFLIGWLLAWLIFLLVRFFLYEHLSFPGTHYRFDKSKIFDNIHAAGNCILFFALLVKLRISRPKPETEPPAASTGPEGQG